MDITGPFYATGHISRWMVGVLMMTLSDLMVYWRRQVQNSRCESFSSRDKNKYLKHTKDGQWRTEKLELKTGMNILTWRIIQPPMSAASRMRKPVFIQSIDITGFFFSE